VAHGKCKSLRSIYEYSDVEPSVGPTISEQHVSTAHAPLCLLSWPHSHANSHAHSYACLRPLSAQQLSDSKCQQGNKNLGTMSSLRPAAQTHSKRGSERNYRHANHHGSTMAIDAVMCAVTTTAVLLLTSSSPVRAMMSAWDIPGADPSGRQDSAPALNRALAEMCGNASMSRAAPSLVVLDLDGGVCVAHILAHYQLRILELMSSTHLTMQLDRWPHQM
jgi:hypothetical protein